MTELITGAQAALLARDQEARPFRHAFVVVLDGDVSFEQVCWRVAGRLPARFRQIPSGWPVQAWADDPLFDLQGHIRQTELAPGASIESWIEHRLALPSDPSHPLWQAWLVGLPAGGLSALVVFTHPVLADAGEHPHLLAGLFDPEPGEIEPAMPDPPPESGAPSWGQVWAGGPGPALSGLAASVGGAVDHALRGLNAHPADYRVAGVEVSLADVRAVARAFGCTVHDVVVALAADGLSGLPADEARPDPVAVVPLAFADEGGLHAEPRRVVLPLGVDNAADRLDAIATLTRAELDTGTPVPARVLTSTPGLAAPTWHSVAAQTLGAGPHTVVVSNAPGTPGRRFFGRALVRGVTTFLTPTDDEKVTVCATSHGQGVSFGATAMAPLAGFGRGVLDGLDTLVSLAGRRR